MNKIPRLRPTLALLSVCAFAPAAKSHPTNVADAIQGKAFDPATVLWYTSPAKQWADALPIGNGRLGAMIFGRTGMERIQLNDDTYWSGGPYSQVVQGGYKYLPEIQQLVFQGKWQAAQKLFGRKLLGYPAPQQKYQPLANLVLTFEQKGKPSGYTRWLDLETGITGVQYEIDGVAYQREAFASVPGQVIAMHLTASKPGSISFTAQLRGVTNQTMGDYGTDTIRMDGLGRNELELRGKSTDYVGIKGQEKYEARLKAIPEGGDMTVSGDILTIKNADAVTLYFVAATSFLNYKNVSANQDQRVVSALKGIQDAPYERIKRAHISTYKKLFDRVKLDLPITTASYEPTNVRLTDAALAPDPALVALAYQFGRYVLISTSQPGTQPANLQGIWNEDSNPMWGSRYTTNINLEMNYWAVDSANLSELDEPLTRLVEDVSHTGVAVARQEYGARGWVFHQNTDLWKVAASMDGPTWGTFTTGGAWLTNELFQHYLYTMDKGYLTKIYPLMKGSVQFFMDFLVKQPNNKWFVTNPSTSPENFPKRPGNGPFFDEVTGFVSPGTNISAGSAIDMEILHELFGNYLQATRILNVDKAFAKEVARKRSLLLPPQVGKNGALQEWAQDWGQMEKHHRHNSPLYGLYPGTEFSLSRTPQLVKPIIAVLNERGDGGPEWSRAWKVALWARLHNGNRANKILVGYLSTETNIQLLGKISPKRGTRMQVDGTLGITAGISAMLVQSGQGKIVLLPALPDDWPSGHFDGVMARGHFEIDMQWKNRKLVKARILSKSGGLCRIAAKDGASISSHGVNIALKKDADGVVEFMTTKGGVYTLTPA